MIFFCFEFSNHKSMMSFIVLWRKWKYDLRLTIYGRNFTDIWYFPHVSDKYVFFFAPKKFLSMERNYLNMIKTLH